MPPRAAYRFSSTGSRPTSSRWPRSAPEQKVPPAPLMTAAPTCWSRSASSQADRDQQVGAAVIKGAGGTFCSGAERGHLDEVGRDPVEENRYAALGGIYRAFTRVGQLEMPTIAAVRGAAVGAGINLMLATDLRVVAEDARLISGFLRIGLHPGGGHFGLLAGRAGAEAAAAAGIFGEEISGLRAAQLGLAWEALPSA